MAETLTYDAGTDTITTEDNLSEAEQESLQVGEEMESQQEQLLAGKYKNAEDLEKAYVELQKKLGSESSEESEVTEDSSETSEDDEEEVKDEPSPALALVNEAAAEYWENNKELTPETMEKLGAMSGTDLLAAYLEAQKNSPIEDTPDLSSQNITEVQSVVGTKEEYGQVVQWAADNLSKAEVASFDELVSSGNVGAIKLAVSGIKAQYDNANGYEGTMISGKPPTTSKDVFRSQAELVAAMGDPRYEKDSAYRQDVIEKLDRSSNVKF